MHVRNPGYILEQVVRVLPESLAGEEDTPVALSLNQARSVYDRIGRVQDWQAFYEDATTERLVANAALDADQTIFEFGCGTGRLAAHLLEVLPASVHYLGVDISPVMINLATSRLATWADRAKAMLVDGSLPLPADDGFADRVLSTFVFDRSMQTMHGPSSMIYVGFSPPTAGSAWPASPMETGCLNGPSREPGPACGALRRSLWAGVAPSP